MMEAVNVPPPSRPICKKCNQPVGLRKNGKVDKWLLTTKVRATKSMLRVSVHKALQEVYGYEFKDEEVCNGYLCGPCLVDLERTYKIFKATPPPPPTPVRRQKEKITPRHTEEVRCPPESIKTETPRPRIPTQDVGFQHPKIRRRCPPQTLKNLHSITTSLQQYKYLQAFRQILMSSPKTSGKAFEKLVQARILKEMKKFGKTKRARFSTETVTGVDSVLQFRWEKILQDAAEHMPILTAALRGAMCMKPGKEHAGKNSNGNDISRMGFVLFILLYTMNPYMFKMVQQLCGLQMWQCGGNEKLFKCFNDLGICQSSKTTVRLIDFLRNKMALEEELTLQEAHAMDADQQVEPPLTTRSWEHLFDGHSGSVGFVTSFLHLQNLLREYELCTSSQVMVIETKQDFGKEPDFQARDVYLHWEDAQRDVNPPLPYDGVPFIIMGSRILACHHEPDTNGVGDVMDKQNGTDAYTKPHHTRLQTAVKLNSSAIVLIRHVVKFPEYGSVEAVSMKKERDTVSSRLAAHIKGSGDTRLEHRYYISLPKADEHQDHVTEQVSAVMPVDREFIHKTVAEDTSYEMPGLVEMFIKNNVFKIKDKQRTVRTHMLHGTKRSSVSSNQATSVDNVVETIDSVANPSSDEVNDVAGQLRTCLKTIEDLTYSCTDVNALRAALSGLEEVRDKLSSACPHEGPLLQESHALVAMATTSKPQLPSKKKCVQTKRKRLLTSVQARANEDAMGLILECTNEGPVFPGTTTQSADATSDVPDVDMELHEKKAKIFLEDPEDQGCPNKSPDN